ncbi:cytochrome c oxidase subunit 8A, mitochondrial-like [Tubulanus polymorphus]|uniref:cytochrome c oxidase subunit 8A, mitochondrial-like n=1 Tax=Tubulanus polymorphus TaxID=672921 RepID=UPI003DA55AF9
MSGILRGISSRALPLVRLSGIQRANLVSGPPKNRISFPEKAGVGIVMSICVVAPAGYIMMNIENYKKRD